jgi:hypothetical protein
MPLLILKQRSSHMLFLFVLFFFPIYELERNEPALKFLYFVPSPFLILNVDIHCVRLCAVIGSEVSPPLTASWSCLISGFEILLPFSRSTLFSDVFLSEISMPNVSLEARASEAWILIVLGSMVMPLRSGIVVICAIIIPLFNIVKRARSSAMCDTFRV